VILSEDLDRRQPYQTRDRRTQRATNQPPVHKREHYGNSPCCVEAMQLPAYTTPNGPLTLYQHERRQGQMATASKRAIVTSLP
jgi:hypothetical protein